MTTKKKEQKLIKDHEIASYRIAEHLLKTRKSSEYKYHPDQVNFCGFNIYRPDLENALERMMESSFEEHESGKNQQDSFSSENTCLEKDGKTLLQEQY